MLLMGKALVVLETGSDKMWPQFESWFLDRLEEKLDQRPEKKQKSDHKEHSVCLQTSWALQVSSLYGVDFGKSYGRARVVTGSSNSSSSRKSGASSGAATHTTATTGDTAKEHD